MNDLFYALGIESWKGWLGTVLLPPVPFLVMILIGARIMFRRRLLAWSLVLTGTLGIWLMSTTAVSHALLQALTMPPRLLATNDIADLKRAPKTAIVILGGGRRLLAPEYGMSDLKPYTAARLRYGMYLAKETGLPVAFSGGVGFGAQAGPSEAEIAARIAEREYNRPIRWTETTSRDTGENALRTVDLMKAEGITRIVLVTHDFHMRRAMAAFERASQRTGFKLEVVPAPMGQRYWNRTMVVDWLPTADGFEETRVVLHEWLGRLAGA